MSTYSEMTKEHRNHSGFFKNHWLILKEDALEKPKSPKKMTKASLIRPKNEMTKLHLNYMDYLAPNLLRT